MLIKVKFRFYEDNDFCIDYDNRNNEMTIKCNFPRISSLPPIHLLGNQFIY